MDVYTYVHTHTQAPATAQIMTTTKQFPGLTPDLLLNQNLWKWDQKIWRFKIFWNDSYSQPGTRTTNSGGKWFWVRDMGNSCLGRSHRASTGERMLSRRDRRRLTYAPAQSCKPQSIPTMSWIWTKVELPTLARICTFTSSYRMWELGQETPFMLLPASQPLLGSVPCQLCTHFHPSKLIPEHPFEFSSTKKTFLSPWNGSSYLVTLIAFCLLFCYNEKWMIK